MKTIIITFLALTIATNANAAEELLLENQNGDTEIYIKKSGEYVNSGILADEKPTLKVYEAAPVVNIYEVEPAAGIIPVIIKENDYEALVDTGGNYDNINDVYRPNIAFPAN